MDPQRKQQTLLNEEVRLTEEKNERRRRTLVKYTLVAMLGYLVPMSAYTIVRFLGFATYTYWNLVTVVIWIILSGIVTLGVIRSKRIITVRFINAISYFQLVGWVVVFCYLVSFLNELRLSALLCAFMGIIFLLPARGFFFSLMLSSSAAAGYAVISYYQIHYGNQMGTFPLELMYVWFFFFTGIFVAWTADIFAKQRKETVEAKRRAESANRAKSEFLANMSHELRTPLNHIVGFTELVADKRVGELNAVQQEYLNDVLGSSKHLLSLINDILDLSKVEAGKMKLDLSEVNIGEILNSSLGMIREKALKHGIGLALDFDGIPEVIQGDERKLKQIMYNLVSNAVKFTPDQGSIVVSARHVFRIDDRLKTKEGSDFPVPSKLDDCLKGQGFITVSVSDTGIGIAPENLERIFSPFEQVDGSASRMYQGTGLGLSLTRNLIELHEGRIWAESGGDGKGSTFRFVIPLENPSLAPSHPETV